MWYNCPMGIRIFTKKDKQGKQYTRYGFDYRDDNGIRHRKENCKTKGEAEIAYKKALKESERAKPANENKKLTFASLTESFLTSHCKVHCSLATQNKYESLNKTHVSPFFEGKRVADIKMMDINNFIAEMQAKNLSEKSINVAIGLVSTIFNYGINCELISNNPCRKIKKLRLPHKERNFLTEEQARNLLCVCKEHDPRFYPIVYTALFTGIRKGEICALTWDKIDFKAKKILVSKSVYKNNMQETKTPQSVRKVDMIDSLASVLKEHRANSPLSEYVFWSRKGSPLSGDATLWRHFNLIRTKCGLKDIDFHDLRHSFASLLIARNVPIKYIQKQLGHSSIKMTLDTYGHLMPEVYDQAVSILEEIATGKSKTINAESLVFN